MVGSLSFFQTPTNPDGQVNLDHVEENKRDVAAILL